MTHRLSGVGSHNLGYDALPWEMIVHGNCGEYGRYTELEVLPDKVARYLFEFDSESHTFWRYRIFLEVHRAERFMAL